MPRKPTVPFVGCACGIPECPMYSLCHCGCGLKTSLAASGPSSEGRYRGKPCKFIIGHQTADRSGVVDTGEFRVDGDLCRLIPLTRGQYAIVNSCNYERFTKHKYHASHDERTGKIYAARSVRNGRTKEMIYMHREILGLALGDPRQADHREPMATTLNIFKNIRVVPKEKNDWNKRGWGKSGFKWAHYHQFSGLYHSVVTISGVRYSLGYHRTAKQAHLKALGLSQKLQGEYSRSDHRKKRK